MAESKHTKTGRALALELLRHFESCPTNKLDCYQWSLLAMFREKGTKQDNAVLSYLMRCEDPDALAGFCAVLTDYLGACVEGCVPDVDSYERLSGRDITGRPRPWPTMEEGRQLIERERSAFRGFMGRLINGERRI